MLCWKLSQQQTVLCMFRHQTHPRNVHPYQTTIVPRTDAQFQNSTQQRMKYPWLENPPFQPPPEYLSTNSSASENYQVAHHYTNVPPHTHWTTRSQSDGLSSPVYHTPHGEDDHRLSPSLLGVYSKPYQPGVEIPTYTLPLGVQESGSSAGECCESGRGASPAAVARSPVPSEAPGGCGGHCPGFQYVCYYVLQIIFVVGILTGISLCIAGSVLRRSNRGGDLGVLVYIGCLASMVCSLLLGVQCCVRRNNKQRGKQLRMRTAAPDCIQLDTIPNLAVDERDGGGHSLTMQHSGPGQTVAARQLQPLLFPTGTFLTSTATFPRDYYRSSQRYMQPSPTEELNGVPWWRRQQHQ